MQKYVIPYNDYWSQLVWLNGKIIIIYKQYLNSKELKQGLSLTMMGVII